MRTPQSWYDHTLADISSCCTISVFTSQHPFWTRAKIATVLDMADSGLYSAENVARLSAAGVRWISRVPDTSQRRERRWRWLTTTGSRHGSAVWAPLPQAPAGQRWAWRGRPKAKYERATLQRQVETTWAQWEKARWHLGNQRSPTSPMPRPPSLRTSRNVPSGSRCRPASSPSPSRAILDARVKVPRHIASSGRSRRRSRSRKKR